MDFQSAWHVHDSAARTPREAGCVYTSRALALRLAEAVLAPLPASTAPALLDPACGGGALLLGAVEWAARERPDWLPHWFAGGMRGWDASASAVTHCNGVMAAAAEECGVEPALIAQVRDGLLESAEQFDAVLANPPWISYSGRQANSLDAEARGDLQARFESFRGWPALHAAFAEQCAQLTRQDGRCGLLLPLQVADLAGYESARGAMTRILRVESLTDLGERAFAEVTEPAGMFILARGQGASRWSTEADQPLLIAARRFAPLPAEAFGDIGVHTGNAAQLLITDAPEPGAQPIRGGRDIEPFALDQPSHWLREAELPEGRYARRAPAARYHEAVIVLRQTASRPIAARHEPSALFRNSVLACFGAPGHDPDYLLGVFNSDTAARLHRAQFRDARQRAFPQVKISHLRALPVPGSKIGPLYDQIANAARAATAGQAGAAARVNELVEQAYQVEPAYQLFSRL